MTAPHTNPRSAAVHSAAARPAAPHPGGGTPFSCGHTRPRGPAAGTLAAQVAAFNLDNPIGTAGFVMRDNGQVVPTTVAAPAIIFAGHVAVACFAGMRGFYSIDRFVKGED